MTGSGPWPALAVATDDATTTVDEVGGVVDALSPREVLALYCRQTDELARTVESALAEESEHHREQLRVLEERHRRHTTVLTLLADALGEKNAQLDEVAHHLGVVGGAG